MGHIYNIENSLKFKLLAFWRKWTPFIDQKCTYEKVPKLGRASPFPSFGQNPKEQQILRGVPSISTSQTMRTKQKIFAVSLWNRPLVGARSLLQLQISFNFRFRTTATTLHRFLHTWYQNTRTFCTIWSYTFHTFFTSDGRIERFFSETLSITKENEYSPLIFYLLEIKDISKANFTITFEIPSRLIFGKTELIKMPFLLNTHQLEFVLSWTWRPKEYMCSAYL